MDQLQTLYSTKHHTYTHKKLSCRPATAEEQQGCYENRGFHTKFSHNFTKQKEDPLKLIILMMIDNLCVFVTNAEILHMQDFVLFFILFLRLWVGGVT